MFIRYTTVKDGKILEQAFPLDSAYMGDRDFIGRAKTALQNMTIPILGPTAKWVSDNTLALGYYKNDNGDVLSVSPFPYTLDNEKFLQETFYPIK